MDAQARTIGQLARAAGVGVETIRFYERKGLIARPAAPAAGYRRYGEDALVRLRYIRLAKGLGLSLKDMAELIGRLDQGPAFCASVRAAVEQRLAQLDAEVRALKALRQELTGFLGKCRARPADQPCPTIQALTTGAMTPLSPRG